MRKSRSAPDPSADGTGQRATFACILFPAFTPQWFQRSHALNSPANEAKTTKLPGLAHKSFHMTTLWISPNAWTTLRRHSYGKLLKTGNFFPEYGWGYPRANVSRRLEISPGTNRQTSSGWNHIRL